MSSKVKGQKKGKKGKATVRIPVTKGGMTLSAPGIKIEYHIKTPTRQRRGILNMLVTVKHRDALKVFRQLGARRTLLKNKNPQYFKILTSDMNYLKKKYKGTVYWP